MQSCKRAKVQANVNDDEHTNTDESDKESVRQEFPHYEAKLKVFQEAEDKTNVDELLRLRPAPDLIFAAMTVRTFGVHGENVVPKFKWSKPNTAATQLADMDPIIEKSKGDKQPKIASSFLKKAKAKLGKPFAKLVLYEALPARVVKSPFQQPTLQAATEVGRGVRGPSAYEITNVYLNQEYNEIRA
ncbi:tryptophan aminotransferase-related protein 4 [Corchorus capsularis]|uniref:Tryptophan aminotransferase-related protein 4 n=1 Tax=Corchorus capsularis TaxID=210143 RepID=A0A1R3IN93_COCAP|nr:tryptophan aminotransferase-related protein 4 [Corchorus capsularis]